MKFSASSLILLAPVAAKAVLSDDCRSGLTNMYNMSSLTYQTIHHPDVMRNMTVDLETLDDKSYSTFNGNTEALANFTVTCEMYNQTVNGTNNSAGGRVTRFSDIADCTESHNIAIPACVPVSCGMNDTMIASALSYLFEIQSTCSGALFLPADENITAACLSDVVNSVVSPLNMDTNMTKDESCEMSNGTVIDVAFEQICTEVGLGTEVVNDVYCVPSSCESIEAVSDLFRDQLVDLSLRMDNETLLDCNWVYKDSLDAPKNNTGTNSTGTDEVIDELDCVETGIMTSKSSKNKNSKSKSNKNKSSKSKGKGSKSEDSSHAPSKKTKSCKKKKGSLRTRTTINDEDLKIPKFNPFNLERK